MPLLLVARAIQSLLIAVAAYILSVSNNGLLTDGNLEIPVFDRINSPCFKVVIKELSFCKCSIAVIRSFSGKSLLKPRGFQVLCSKPSNPRRAQRNPGLHGGAGRRRNEKNSRRHAAGHRGRRSHSRDHRRDGRRRALHSDQPRGPHSSYRGRTDPDVAW